MRSKNFVRFARLGNFDDFFHFCFEFGVGPFLKVMKIQIALLRRLNICLLIYFYDIRLLGKMLKEILMSRDTLIFLLQCLDFVKNLKKSVLGTSHKI